MFHSRSHSRARSLHTLLGTLLHTLLSNLLHTHQTQRRQCYGGSHSYFYYNFSTTKYFTTHVTTHTDYCTHQAHRRSGGGSVYYTILLNSLLHILRHTTGTEEATVADLFLLPQAEFLESQSCIMYVYIYTDSHFACICTCTWALTM